MLILMLMLMLLMPLWHGSAAAQSAAPPAEPILRIETSAHNAPIRALDVDAAGRYAVTASEDKTARVWDLSSGRLTQTLRPPVGPGNDGKLFASAITPNGAIIAVGGWSPDNDVYLFDRASGAMIQRITGLPNTITQLAFAPDGLSLVIGLWGKHGIRLFSTSSQWRGASTEIGSDAQYDGEVYRTRYSPDGRQLATASVDGLVRLYDVAQRRLTLLQRARPAGGGQPYNVAYSPDGKLMAVSFSDTATVTVLQATTLQPAYTPSIAGVTNGSLSALTWSADGRELLAAGTWKRADGSHGLRRWADGGKGAATDSALASNSVMGLRTLADGRMLFAAADPVWGWIASSASMVSTRFAVPSGLTDFREGRTGFRVARDASAVSFSSRSDSGTLETVGFDVRNAAWTAPQPQWTAPSASSRNLTATDWFEGIRPSLNGRQIALTDNEVAISVATAPDGSGAALGTSFYLRFVKADGTALWRAAAPGTTWQVNVSGDGRWVVAGFSDGTVRWYRAKDGVEMLALLPHADRKRWVAWTPQGYYAASPGGEDLFGWQLNRGNSAAADFFPASRFRATYFRPDIVAAVLTTADFDAALRLVSQANAAVPELPAPSRPVAQPAPQTAPPSAIPPTPSVPAPTLNIEQKTPPVVTVLSPRDGDTFSSREVTLSISIRAPTGAPAQSLKARLNGQIFELPLAQASAWPTSRILVIEAAARQELAPVRYEQRITLPAEDAELMVFADNRNGYSTPAVVRLKWTGARDSSAGNPATRPAPAGPAPTNVATPAPAAVNDLRPALYVLAVGVSKYQNANIQLEFASKDATDFARVFKLQENQLYRKVEVRLLTDAGAKRDDILDGLEWIRREMTARDVGVVFMAGHGVNDADGVYYYLPQDTDPDRLKRTGVIFTEIKNTLAALPGKALFFVDTCHSGNVLGTGRRAIANDLTAVVNELSSAENGVIVFAASTGRQFAQESPEWGNGAFTKAVIEGMSGKADVGRTGRVTHKMLDLYVSERVKSLTRGSQSPVTIVPQGISDFPVAFSR